jgi:dipeptidyl-peptidase 4
MPARHRGRHHRNRRKAVRTAACVLVGCFAIAGCAGLGAPRAAPSGAVDPDRYLVAQRFFPAQLVGKVRNAAIVPSWIGATDTFWYRQEHRDGHEFVRVDAATGVSEPAFDHAAVAAAIAAILGGPFDPANLPIADLAFGPNGERVVFDIGGQALACRRDGEQCARREIALARAGELASPDGSMLLFAKDHNLWVRAADGGAERQLTSDGEPNAAYALPYLDTGRVARRRAGAAEPLSGAVWSPDSRFVVALRSDYRALPTGAYVVEHLPPLDPRPYAHVAPMRYPGDPQQELVTLVVISAATGESRRAALDANALGDYAPFYLAAGFIGWDLAAHELYVVTSSRDARTIGVVAVNLTSGAVRPVLQESDTRYLNLNPNDDHLPNVVLLADRAELIWWSERDGWGHLYRYDARTGNLLGRITEGEWVVFDMLRVDATAGFVYFTAGGREPGRNPYYPHLYRARLDGSDVTLITPEDAFHEYAFAGLAGEAVTGPTRLSPSGNFIVDTYSTVREPPVTVIRRTDGTLVREVARADASALYDLGWRPPEPFVAKAADGQTDLYGALFMPHDFDRQKRYAVVENIYAGPQLTVTPHRFLDAVAGLGATYSQSLAELGMIAIVVDGRGSPRRRREFHLDYLPTVDPFGITDHVAAIKELAAARPYVDTERVGVIGTSFGGYSATRAMLLYPDFYKAGVAAAAPQDFRTMVSDARLERIFGAPQPATAEPDRYTQISNTYLAPRLAGPLLLIHGEIDENVPLNQPLAMIDALVAAGKDFDFLLVPNMAHAVIAHPYAGRRLAEFLFRHLGGPASAAPAAD